VYTLIVGLFIYRSIGFRQVPRVLYDSARFAAISLFCVGTASAFGWILAYFQIPRALVTVIESWGAGLIATGFICAGAFLIIGMFIDAIPAIIILGTILWPVTQKVGMHPVHFAIIGVISLAFGLVTPPYGLCLLIACALGKIKLVDALKDVVIILIPMILVLIFVILFPGVILALPRFFMGKYM
jgi:TRAP-type C4-dicarboxylate transport system permease large subunit